MFKTVNGFWKIYLNRERSKQKSQPHLSKHWRMQTPFNSTPSSPDTGKNDAEF